MYTLIRRMFVLLIMIPGLLHATNNYQFKNDTQLNGVFHIKWTSPNCPDEDLPVMAGQNIERSTMCDLAQVTVTLEEVLGLDWTGAGSPVVKIITVSLHSSQRPSDALLKVSGPRSTEPKYVLTIEYAKPVPKP